MRKTPPRRRGWVASGPIIFFLLVAIIIQIAILIFDAVQSRTDNNAIIAIVMLGVIIVLALLCTIVDVIRRKVMIDIPTDKILEATEKIASGDFRVELEINHSYNKYNYYDLIMENINKMTAELSRMEMLHADFVSNVSHELKTPLAIIKNYAVALSDESLDDATRKKYTKTLIQATSRLNDLVVNILKLNKLENQEIVPEKEEIRLHDVLAESVIAFEDVIEQKNITLNCDIEEITLVSTPSYLEIVFNNLLSNAVKFTPFGGKIDVMLKKQGQKAVVTVADTGCGISQTEGARIFEKFYQADTSHKEEGNGLGLALVKKVIDVLGGEILVDSIVDKGTAFTVKLDL